MNKLEKIVFQLAIWSAIVVAATCVAIGIMIVVIELVKYFSK